MTRIMRKTSNGFEEIFNSSTIADLTSRIETLESNWNSVLPARQAAFHIKNVSKSFSVAANGYVNIIVSAPAVSGYTYLGLVGCRQGLDSRIAIFSISPSDVGIASHANSTLSGTMTFTLLYGRNGF